MSRPPKKRTVCLELKTGYFSPQGINQAEEVILEVDEIEAVRLADLEGKYQADAAVLMNVSRSTFGNIVNQAHAKIAEALIKGKAIRINCPRFAGKRA